MGVYERDNVEYCILALCTRVRGLFSIIGVLYLSAGSIIVLQYYSISVLQYCSNTVLQYYRSFVFECGDRRAGQAAPQLRPFHNHSPPPETETWHETGLHKLLQAFQ